MNVAILKDHRPQTSAGLSDAWRGCRAERVQELRERALRDFERFGLPSRRVEDFKYTDLRAIMRYGRAVGLSAFSGRDAGRARLIAQRGLWRCPRPGAGRWHVCAELSDLAGVEQGLSIRTVGEALASGDADVASLLRR